jgi:uncharacterized membrane protein (UPF0127 family)
MTASFRFFLLALCTVTVALSGCNDEQTTSVEAQLAGVDAWLPLRINTVPIEVQIPISRTEMSRGLMYRESLPTDSGMLFPYTEPQQVAFWMANTPLPLDIGFFDSNGNLLEIHRMVPFDTTRTVSRSDQVRFALEMNRGWFASHQLFPGARLDMQLLARALAARGAEPADFGL